MSSMFPRRTRLKADRATADGFAGEARAVVIAAARFGRMKVIATDQGAGRLYECPCGRQRWSAWGNAEHHAQTCAAADTPAAIGEAKREARARG